MGSYQEKLGGLASRLKSEKPNTPIQEVHPVRQTASAKEEEEHLNVWLPKSLFKRMKAFGVEHDLFLKDISIEAITAFLDGRTKQG